MSGEYRTKGEGISVGWRDDKAMAEKFGGRPVVEIGYYVGGNDGTAVTIVKPYPSIDEAKAAAKALAVKADEIAPNGVGLITGPTDKEIEALRRLDAYAIEWAGPEAKIDRVD
jgi:hypothetical protein